VVVAQGRVLQTGTHHSLLEDVGGTYWKLVNAQLLNANINKTAHNDYWGEKGTRFDSSLNEKESYDTLVEPELELIDGTEQGVSEKLAHPDFQEAKPYESKIAKPAPKPSGSVGFMRSFAMLLLEQKHNWASYIIITVAAAGAGCKYNKRFSTREWY
jgi:ATP-binding cassette, subfamily B (MDR/TAP), member 1